MQTATMALVVEGAGAAAHSGVLERSAAAIWAGPGYFALLGIPILYGHAFDAGDRADMPRVAVVSESMATRQFGAVNAVGRRFRLEHDATYWIELVGVARDTGTADLLAISATRRRSCSIDRSPSGMYGNDGAGTDGAECCRSRRRDAARAARGERHARPFR